MYLLLLFPLLFWLPGSSYEITGPEEVNGLEQGSLTVQCHYDPGWETYRKWWCRGAEWSRCKILVKTTGTEVEVKKDHVSIRDNQRSHVFTVTMEKLRQEDTGVYWCGIERTGTDLGIQIKVTIVPVSTTTTTTITSATNTSTVPVSSEDTTGSLTVTSHHSNDSGAQMKLRVLLPLLFALLLLLVVSASLLAWKMLKRQKKAAEMFSEQVLQTPESDLCYANLALEQPGTFPSSSRNKAPTKPSSLAQEDQVEYVTMASVLREDISYAALSLDTLDQDATYMNTGDPITQLPNRSHEESTEYSTIRKP
ncbi:CMRF35-like molecule 1 isoform X2 [Saccopteryx bilineata]|uniref:CMRF35-like molecule 1 isoform X2 n=1 Tax=Saccopteryx bilineata TaxID=59482 RepID=UPI00338FAC7C